ncbi:LysR family transcriptional regulator [Clostridium sp. MCC353]|uniref:LysR family transcriptional regulator n=1 Tax=Clostridium sp. MCC353 TaxID=2592646 RepID=UPI001C02C0C8|nr:LysR family transcriptional regulator [Clostridium sp. MCC353]MBT9778058.1 LysR family transcriptional regulator [Clostridium sp. MCC353]
MDTRYLEYVLAIAEYKTISKAAQKLYISQPTLSLFLSNLENEIGLQLFQRNRTELKPTYAGSLYIKTAKKIILLKEDLYQQFNEIIAGNAGCISIGFMTVAGSAMFSSVFPEFKKIHPKIELAITEAKTADLIEKLLNSELNIAIIASMVPKSSALQYVTVKQEEFYLTISKKNPLAETFLSAGHPLTPEDLLPLKDAQIVLSPKNTVKRQVEDSILKSYPLDSSSIYEISNTLTLLNVIESGMGTAFVPAGFRTSNTGNYYFPLSTSPHWYLAAAYPNHYALSDAERTLIELVQNYYSCHDEYTN